MWVFPGGRVDPEDVPEDGDELEAAAASRGARGARGGRARRRRHCHGAVRVLGPAAAAPKRFATWFFMGPAPAGAVTVDGGEIHDHRWIDPSEALARRDAGEIELAPPTWITLHRLAPHAGVAAALGRRGHGSDRALRDPHRAGRRRCGRDLWRETPATRRAMPRCPVPDTASTWWTAGGATSEEARRERARVRRRAGRGPGRPRGP